MTAPTAAERFATKYVVDPSGCWEWTASRSRDGYGQFHYQQADRTEGDFAHRASYELHVGPIPPGLQIDHLCRNRGCVNPEHLEPVTCRENVLRGESLAALGATRTHCPRGHPYSGDNLKISSAGKRVCRECARTWRERDPKTIAAKEVM